MKKLFVVRHGETSYNRDNLICGVTEADLTEKGRAQAQTLAALFKEQQSGNDIRYIYVSPLRRARETCSYIEKSLSLTAIVEPRLIEFNFGTSEGVQSDDPQFIKDRLNPYARFEGGESMFFAAQRLYNLIDDIKKRHADKDGSILFVCHGTVSRVIDTYFRNVSIKYFTTYKPANCEIHSYDL